jgi:hypothetical protein
LWADAALLEDVRSPFWTSQFLLRGGQTRDGVLRPPACGDDDRVLDASLARAPHLSANSQGDSRGFSRVLTVFSISP